MSTRKIRWGILGVAKINDRLLPSFAKLTNGELVAIASRSLDCKPAEILAKLMQRERLGSTGVPPDHDDTHVDRGDAQELSEMWLLAGT